MSARVASLAAAVLLAACEPAMSVSGSMTSTGAALGDWTFRPEACVAGKDSAFYGVDLSGSTRALRVVDDPLKGYVVTVAPDGDPGDPRVWLSPTSGCKRFAAVVGGEDDTEEGLSGSVTLDCALDAGGAIAGAITFAHCRSASGY